jgi:hypothetical protein
LQAKPHVLVEHVGVAFPTLVVHLFPHAPQLFRSLVSSTHEPPQFVCVPEQPDVQAEPEQLGVPASALHPCPHEPQLFLSLVVSTQAFPHLV